jgi:broad specificity phosphatase PhoE
MALALVTVAHFVRHGQASAFSADYDQLSPLGVEQSELLGAWLAGELASPSRRSADAVFIGPRKRHAQTYASAIGALSARGLHLPEPTLLPELDEHDGIALVFKLLPHLAPTDPELAAIAQAMFAAGGPTPEHVLAAFKRITRRWVRGEVAHDDVEPWAAFRARVVRALAILAQVGADKTALVFTSAGVIAAATAEALEIRDEEKVLDLSWALYNGSITELDFTGERWNLRTFNATAHLREKRLFTSL